MKIPQVIALAVLLAAPPAALAQARRPKKVESPPKAEGQAPPGAALGSRAQGEADAALISALEWMFAPAPREIRVIAVEDLALLGDPRGLNPLAHMILDPDPGVAAAAVRAVGRFRHPRAEEILSNLVHHPTLVISLKVAAIRALPFQDTPASRELLTVTSTSEQQAPPVRAAALEVLKQMAPGQQRPGLTETR